MTKEGWMCATDFYTELGMSPGSIHIFGSEEECRKERCVDEFGMVKVDIKVVKEVLPVFGAKRFDWSDQKMSLKDVLEVLVSAHRMGTKEDVPEGSRYIKISETLVNQMISAIRQP